jgi:hypothetical protein
VELIHVYHEGQLRRRSSVSALLNAAAALIELTKSAPSRRATSSPTCPFERFRKYHPAGIHLPPQVQLVGVLD